MSFGYMVVVLYWLKAVSKGKNAECQVCIFGLLARILDYNMSQHNEIRVGTFLNYVNSNAYFLIFLSVVVVEKYWFEKEG